MLEVGAVLVMAMLASTLLPAGCAFIKGRSSRQMALHGGRGTCTSQKGPMLAAVSGKASVMCAEGGAGRDPLMARLFKGQSEYNGEVEVLEVICVGDVFFCAVHMHTCEGRTSWVCFPAVT